MTDCNHRLLQLPSGRLAEIITLAGGLVGNREKAELRRQCHRIREALSPKKVQDSSDAVCAHLSDWPPFQQSDTVLSFLAFRNEIDLGELFESWPEKRWLVPRVVEGAELTAGQKPHLVLHLYDATRLVRHPFGMLQPEPDLPIVDPREVQVALVPGVAFDQKGGRLGFGGGFYDRLLPIAHGAIRVGVTYEELVLDVLPTGPWDCRVVWIVTPAGLIRTGEEQLQRN